jgi:hypothetical protein
MIRYPHVTTRPVSGAYPDIQDVVCTACGTTHTVCRRADAETIARWHRWAHASFTVCATTIAAAVAVACFAVAARFPQLETWPPLAAVVGGLAGLVGARVLSPTRLQRHVSTVGRDRGDA